MIPNAMFLYLAGAFIGTIPKFLIFLEGSFPYAASQMYIPSSKAWRKMYTWMSRWKLGSMVRING